MNLLNLNNLGFIKSNSGVFSPKSISNLVLWLDANQQVFTDDAGTTPATNNSRVQRWNDLSGNGRNAVNANVNNSRPVLKTNTINSLPTIEFLSAEARIMTLGSAFTNGTIFIVAKNNFEPAATNQGLYNETSPVDADSIYFFIQSGVNGFFASRNANLNIFINGVDTDSLSGIMTNYNIFTGNDSSPTSRPMMIGDDRGLGRYWDGSIAEIIVYSTSLSTAEQRQLERYLSLKYNITVV